MRGFLFIVWMSLCCAVVRAESMENLPAPVTSPYSSDFDPPPVTPETAPQAPPRERISVSTAEPREESIVDLRPPEFPLDGIWTEIDQSWLNEVIDDHLLLWRNVTDSMQSVPRLGTDFGITTLGFKLDLVKDKGPFWVAGYFGWNFLSGPTTAAVPPQTYDLGVELNYAKKMNETWAASFTISPLFSTDFANKTSDAFRLTAGGLLTYQADDVTRLVAGLSYLARPDLPFLPIAGLKWMVTDDIEFDILVPRPRLAWRFDQEEDRESWLYTAGEVGGGSWAIEREAQLSDRMGYRDLRWTCGFESRQISGSRRVIEAGYVFDRRLSFQRGSGDEKLGSAFVVQWGRVY